MKKCPFCAELIQDEAVVCRYCNRELPVQSVPVIAVPKQPAGKKTSPILIILLVGLACLIGLCFLGWVGTLVVGNKREAPKEASSSSSERSTTKSDATLEEDYKQEASYNPYKPFKEIHAHSPYGDMSLLVRQPDNPPPQAKDTAALLSLPVLAKLAPTKCQFFLREKLGKEVKLTRDPYGKYCGFEATYSSGVIKQVAWSVFNDKVADARVDFREPVDSRAIALALLGFSNPLQPPKYNSQSANWMNFNGLDLVQVEYEPDSWKVKSVYVTPNKVLAKEMQHY